MMTTLLALSLRGTLVYLTVMLLGYLMPNHVGVSGRRWWWLLIAGAFLIPFCFFPSNLSQQGMATITHYFAVPNGVPLTHSPVTTGASLIAPSETTAFISLLPVLWILGAVFYLAFVVTQTFFVACRWSRERLSTDPHLLGLLEDCKAETGVTAPIGIVVTTGISTPALLGWLRPRILLPASLVTTFSREHLHAILLHELAHFRSCDIPTNWLFVLIRALHWFNPLVYLASRDWLRFREEAADEAAMIWLGEGNDYGQTLLATLQHNFETGLPYGALALGESPRNLKHRILMIAQYPIRKKSTLLIAAASMALLALGSLIPLHAQNAPATEADQKKSAVAAILPWLEEIDHGEYAKSWGDASKDFQKAITSESWVAALDSARKPCGVLKSRVLASALFQKDVPSGESVVHGKFIIAQFKSSFENLAQASETVTFQKESDGQWRAAGYYIKPGSL
jgi:beta-lactamase regulating signal transducer with metallopeptidase domain